MTELGNQIIQSLEKGNSPSFIVRNLGVSGATVSYYAKKLGLSKSINMKRYDWKIIQDYYDVGNSYILTIEKFEISLSAMREAKLRNAFIIKRTEPRMNRNNLRRYSMDVFAQNSSISTGTIKKIIIRDNLLPYSCSGKDCIIKDVILPQWANGDLSLHLDHSNGIRNDHRLNNLRFLCPNCHSQTNTYCGRNKRLCFSSSNDRATNSKLVGCE